MAGKQPTHNLCVCERGNTNSHFTLIGVGWVNDRGSIAIKLNPGSSISWRDDLVVYLFNRDNAREEQQAMERFDERNPPMYQPMER